MLSICGCQSDEQPPEAGSNTQTVVHVWQHPGEPPTRIEALHIRQKSEDFKELELDTVLIRLPRASSVVYLASPLAFYAEKANESIILYGHPGDDGPVRFNGFWHEHLFVGRAAHAAYNQKTHGLRFDDVEVVNEGVHEWIKAMTWNDLTSDMDYDTSLRLADTPSVMAAISALPANLDLAEK